MLTTRMTKSVLLAATGLAAAMICAPALAQEAATTTTTTETAAAPQTDDTVVIVKGLRKSLKSAVDRKRNSKQIVDSIDAEDAGKLPDNNVVEALAHVTGVQITRARGEGDSLMIRGQSDIQTTLNGAPNSTGAGRSASLNDIPAELIKSVQVYKTRTADQVEGGIGGTVNVELRRPLDLKKGWTFAGSIRNVYGNIGDTESPYASALVANRFDTPIGEMGFLLNLSYQENNYNEDYVQSETPALFWCCGTQWNSIPVDKQGTDISIYRAQDGVEYGKIRRPSLDASYQWRVNEHLDFVLEASVFNASENRSYSALNTRIKDSPGVLSNVVYGPDGHTIVSMTETDPNLTDYDWLPVGPQTRDDYNETKNTRINFETHWHDDRTTINASIYRDTNDFNNQWYTQLDRLKNLASFDVDVNSSVVPGGGPLVVYKDKDGNAIDTTDTSNYALWFLENGKTFVTNTETAWAADMTYRVSDDKLIRSVQVGVRHSDRDVSQAYGYRYAWFGRPYDTYDHTLDLSSVPGGDDLVPVSVEIPGFDSPTWYRISRQGILNNWDALRALAGSSAASESGGSGNWADETVSTEQLASSFVSEEKTAAIFGNIYYGFKAWNIPVDGVIGVRTVHTWGTSQGTVYGKTGIPTLVNQASEGTDTMPSANAVVHFTPKLQLRLAYTLNIQRPNFQDASSFVQLYDTVNHYGWGGNPDLQPNKETSYDASLEYYFGRGGVLSAATYLKKPSNFIVWGQTQGVMTDDDNDPSTPDVPYTINRPVNAGPGEYQGFELNAQGFFEFLPAPWSNFGAQANFTYNTKAEIKYAFYNGVAVTPTDIANIPGLFDAPNNSKATYNLALYYDTPKFSARIAFNHRDRYRGYLDGYAYKGYSIYYDPTERLDAAINWTPVKYMTLSLEGTNLTNNNAHATYGQNALLDQGVRVQARTVQLSARFRY